MNLLNTVPLASQLTAHSLKHLAVYSGNTVSIYAKNESDNTLVLQPTTYKVNGVLRMRMSANGKYVAVQTRTKTIVLHDGEQATFTNLGQFDIADTGQLLMLDVNGAVQIITDFTTNITFIVTDDDRVVCGRNSYAVYNRTRYVIAKYSDVVLTPVTAPKEIAHVAHDHNGKFAIFYADGTALYDDVTRTLDYPVQSLRSLGEYLYATDYKRVFCVNQRRPLSLGEPVKTFTWQTPLEVNNDFENALMMVPGSGLTSDTFDVKNKIGIVNNTGLASSSDSPYGSTGKSLLFNGSSSNCQTADTANIQLGASNFTIEMFFRIDSDQAPGTFVLINKGGGLNVAWSSFIIQAFSPSRMLNFAASTSNTKYEIGYADGVNAFGPWEFDTWHHLAVTRNGNKWRCFLDGKLKATYIGSGTITPNAGRGLTIGHGVQANWNTGLNTGRMKGKLNGLQILNYAKYTTDFVVDTISDTASKPAIPVEPATELLSGTTPNTSTSFASTLKLAGDKRMMLPTIDKLRFVEEDMSITELDAPADLNYPAFNVLSDNYIVIAAVGTTGWLSRNGGKSLTPLFVANSYGGQAVKFQGLYYMIDTVNTSVRKYTADMSSYTTVSKTNSVMGSEYWGNSDQCIVSTTGTSANGANLYVCRSAASGMTFTAYNVAVSTNCRVDYIGSNVFYVHSGTVSKLFYISSSTGPTLLATLAKEYTGIMHIGENVIVVDGSNFYQAVSAGADNSAATLADAQVYAAGIVDAVGRNAKALGFTARWITPWKSQKRFMVGSSTNYKIYRAA